MINNLIDADWLNQLVSYHTLYVGFSGGLDSTVLLHNLARQPLLAGKLSAVHIHHGLSAHADAWQAHCETFCSSLFIPLLVNQVAIEQRSNIEEQARAARYAVFSDLLDDNDMMLLAHHADDQAETLLLQLFRGAGIDGMAAMPAVKSLGKGKLVRPFLLHSRKTLEDYADLHQLNWVDDESNQDSAYSRNFLRHQVMPLLRERWPGVDVNLARSARHCQQAKINLQAFAELDGDDLTANTLSLTGLPGRLCERSEAIQRFGVHPLDCVATAHKYDEFYARLANTLRIWLKNNQVRLPSTDTFNRLITEVIHARHDAAPSVEWDSVCVRRYQNKLYILKAGAVARPATIEWLGFPASLPLGDQCLNAIPAEKGLQVPEGSKISIRFRQGGESFDWHGQNKTLKKLFQEWHVPPWERDMLPLIYINDELAAVVGFAVGDRYYAKPPSSGACEGRGVGGEGVRSGTYWVTVL